jgi:hypothetical protein
MVGAMKPVIRRVVAVLAFGLAASFVTLALALAWERPLCCVDDAFFAVVAKNLASGRGYVATLGPFLDRPFAPEISIGPTSILPAAGAIAIFGPDPRVPGLAHILLWVVLLGLALRAATRFGARPWELLGAFALLQFATTALNFEQWYALLGEVPAASLVILGAALLAREPITRRHLFASGLAFGAASLGKLMAVLYLVGPILWIARKLLPRPAGGSPAGVQWALLFGAGLLAPHGAFEAWKLSVLGATGWWQNLRHFSTFVGASGASGVSVMSWAEFGRRITLLDERLIFSPMLFIATVVLGGLAWRGLSNAARRFVVLLLTGVGVNLLYWLVFSSGRPRYAFIAVVVWGFALAFLVATVRTAPLRLGLAAVLMWTLAMGLPRIGRPLELLAMAHRPETSHIAAAEAVTAAIRTRTAGAPIEAQDWGNVSALEYLNAEPGRFRIPPSVDQAAAWVVFDDRVIDRNDEHFVALLAACRRTVARRAPYTLKRCLDDRGGD